MDWKREALIMALISLLFRAFHRVSEALHITTMPGVECVLDYELGADIGDEHYMAHRRSFQRDTE